MIFSYDSCISEMSSRARSNVSGMWRFPCSVRMSFSRKRLPTANNMKMICRSESQPSVPDPAELAELVGDIERALRD
jgi:hypothetical protein